jgi:hypothetical protein
MVDTKADEALDYVRLERSRNVSREERLLILRLHTNMRAHGATNVTKSIVELTGRCAKVVKEVWSEYCRSGTCTEAAPACNKISHTARVPNNIDAHSLVQEFVRQRRLSRTRTVAKDVMAFLIEEGHLQCDQSREKDVHAYLRLGKNAKENHKGRRYCFIAGILDGGEKGKAKKETKDYHAMFDNAFFVAWMIRLLNVLDALGIRNSIITMDNAAYHKCLPDDTPRQGWKKARLQEAYWSYGISFEER